MATNLWPALGATVLDHNGTPISTAGVSLATVTEYYSDLIVSGALVTFDPLAGADPTVAPTAEASRLTSYLTTTIASLSGTASGHAIVLSGRSSVGDGAEGLAVWDAASTATADNATVWGSGTGRWKRVWDGRVLNARWYGVHPTATSSANSDSIANAIAAAIDLGCRIVHIPSGVHNFARTIFLGDSGTISCLELRGEGYDYLGEGRGGTALFAQFSNAPLINVQGSRGSVIRGFALIGLNYDHIADNNLGTVGPLSDDTVAANWWDGLLSANGATRYAPYAGFAIDGWSGSAPATSYPTTHIAYGQSFGSDVLIEDCNIAGFHTAIVNQPCDEDGNGDFTLVRRCNISHCVYGISVGNTQSRQLGIQDVKTAFLHTVLTNNKHGKQLGKFNGTIDNLSFGAGIQMFDFGSSTKFGPLLVTSCYGEYIWRLGDYSAVASSECGVNFVNCQFAFTAQEEESRGVPAKILGGSSQQTALKFDGCIFGNYQSVCTLDQVGITIDNTLFFSASRSASITKTYMALFHNATCDGLILGSGISTDDQRIKFQQYNVDTLSLDNGITARRGMRQADRKRCMPIYIHVVSPQEDTFDECQVRRQYSAIDKATALATAATLTHGASSSAANTGVLTLVLTAATAAEAEYFGYAAGDIIVDASTKSVFAIRSFNDGTNTIVAELQNNYKVSGGNYTTIDAFDGSTGTLYVYNSRLYTPTYPVLADLTAASAVLANTGTDDSFSAFISSGGVPDAIKVDDRAYVAPKIDNYVDYTTNKVTAIAAGGTSITLDGAAARSESRKRLGIWVRKPPANEGAR